VETEGATNDVITWRIRVTCWINKPTCTYAHAHAHVHAPGYPHARTHAQACTHRPICNTAFPLQQWFRERASLLRYTYIACLVTFSMRLPPDTAIRDCTRNLFDCALWTLFSDGLCNVEIHHNEVINQRCWQSRSEHIVNRYDNVIIDKLSFSFIERCAEFCVSYSVRTRVWNEFMEHTSNRTNTIITGRLFLV
jgi:hypothetical protein